MIYFISDGSAIKVGRAKDVASRLKDLNCGNARKLTLVATVDGHSKEEASVHTELASFRLGGEWFADCPEVRSAIRSYCDGGIALRAGEQRRSYRHQKRLSEMPTEADWPTMRTDIDRLSMAEARSHYLKAACAAMESILVELKRLAAIGGDMCPLKSRADQIMREAGLV